MIGVTDNSLLTNFCFIGWKKEEEERGEKHVKKNPIKFPIHVPDFLKGK